MRRCSLLLAVFAVALVGCGIPVESRARQLSEAESLAIATTTTTTVAAAPVPSTLVSEARAALVYFIRGEGLVGRPLVFPSGFTELDLLQSLIDETTLAGANGSVRSGLAQRSDLVEGLIVVDDLAQVSLSTLFADLPGSEQVLVLGQLTLTMLANFNISGVEFRQNAAAVAVPDADGQPISRPATRADYVKLLTR
ncbi:MAG: hypothetical protein ABR58_00970 [Acidimicrobium sp. BACL19 MAG-120924-bin39]|jgi:hypothetical protein|nr:MAG: hypothetical protein ABR58_00970 [Acidimicrobium sp. BACL19 MAG-120924-bin39]